MTRQKREQRDWEQLLTLAEQLAKIISYIAIPIVLAMGGWNIQKAVAQQAVSKDYVQIAVGILAQPKDSIHPEIRNWAVDLINENAPIKFSGEAIAKLKSGEVTLLGACRQSVPPNPKGTTTDIRFINETTNNVTVSFSLANPNIQGECGIYSYAISANATVTSTVLTGCYSAYAWAPSSTKPLKVFGYVCISEFDNVQEILIAPDHISLR